MADAPLFDRVALIGIGLIGSSLARRLRRDGLAREIAAATRSPATLAKVQALKLADRATLDPAEAAKDADLVVICTPMGAYEEVAKVLPSDYRPLLGVKETQVAIRIVKEAVEAGLCRELNLIRVECPLIVSRSR